LGEALIQKMPEIITTMTQFYNYSLIFHRIIVLFPMSRPTVPARITFCLIYRPLTINSSRSTLRSSIQDYESTAVASESYKDLQGTQLSFANEEVPDEFSLENILEDLRTRISDPKRALKNGDIGTLGILHKYAKLQVWGGEYLVQVR